jgi:hypothetical protein
MGAQVKTVEDGEDARLIIDRIDANGFRSTMTVGRQAGIPPDTRTVPGQTKLAPLWECSKNPCRTPKSRPR